jgi:cytochrome c oxidase assembly factor CtaG
LHPADSLHVAALLRTGWGLTPGLDQQVGGLLMWVGGGFVFLAVMIVLFLQWFGMAETDGVAPAEASF